jgi:hypothetical protein
MTDTNNKGCGTLILVALASFFIGRLSVTDEKAEVEPAVKEAKLTDEAIAKPKASNPQKTKKKKQKNAQNIAPKANQFLDAPSEEPQLGSYLEPEKTPKKSKQDVFVYYRNCSAARAAGAAPVYAGDPGYASRLDRDGDGVGCE